MHCCLLLLLTVSLVWSVLSGRDLCPRYVHVQSNGTLLDIRLFLKTGTCVSVLTEIIIYS